MKTTILAIMAVVIAASIVFFATRGESTSSIAIGNATSTQGTSNTVATSSAWRGGTTTAMFTMAEVASHSTSLSCYALVGDSVYDLTAWIAQHPGGEDAIRGLCGKDGTQAFADQHAGQPNPEAALARYRIGSLVR